MNQLKLINLQITEVQPKDSKENRQLNSGKC